MSEALPAGCGPIGLPICVACCIIAAMRCHASQFMQGRARRRLEAWQLGKCRASCGAWKASTLSAWTSLRFAPMPRRDTRCACGFIFLWSLVYLPVCFSLSFCLCPSVSFLNFCIFSIFIFLFVASVPLSHCRPRAADTHTAAGYYTDTNGPRSAPRMTARR